MTMSELDLKPQFITNAGGQRVGVILEMEVYLKLVEALDDLLDRTDFDEALAQLGEAIPFDQAVAEIERNRPTE